MDNATISKIAENHTGPVLYLLRLPEISISGNNHYALYKFGYTENLGQRLKTHLKNLGFTSVVLLRPMGSLADVISLEKQVKRLAESQNERFNLMGNTEIINSTNISDYVTLITTWSPPVTFPEKEKCPDRVDNIETSEQPSSEIVINIANCCPKILEHIPQVQVNVNNAYMANNFDNRKALAARWVSDNPPMKNEPTTNYYDRYQNDAGNDYITEIAFGNVVKNILSRNATQSPGGVMKW